MRHYLRTWRRPKHICFVLVYFTLLTTGITARSSEAVEATVVYLGMRLEQAKTVEQRFAALTEIRKHAKSPKMSSLLDQVADHTRDANAGIRCTAVLALAQISFEHKTDCPRELIAALVDPDSEIRRAAYENIVEEVYASLPDNTAEIAQIVTSEEKFRDVRAAGPMLLQYYSKDKVSEIKLLKKAITDKDYFVQNNAAAALLARDDSVDLAISFFCRSAFDDFNREFYSTKLGWSKIEDADELAVFQQFHYKKLRDVAKKHPTELLRELSKRLNRKNKEIVDSALAQSTDRGTTADDAQHDYIDQLILFPKNQNFKVLELVLFALDQIHASSSKSQ